MEENAITLQKIISSYTPLIYTDIDLSKRIEDRYVATEFKNNFCDDICQTWKNINCTELHNDMFVKFKTGKDILEILKFINL